MIEATRKIETKKKSILLVEDNPGDVLITLRALKKGNICNEVVVAEDGAEALDYLFHTGKYAHLKKDDLPQVILLDLNMPKVNGMEVLQRLRADKKTKLIPVVVLTTSHEEKDVVESYNLGANSYIVKPVDFDKFTAAVQQLGLYWTALNETPSQVLRCK